MNERIAYCAIHPGLGVARVGNSPSAYFLGPEAPGLDVDPDGGFKDGQGRVKRQACRFRVYGFDDQGQALKELTLADADIAWTVHLANKKAAWFRFRGLAEERRAQETGEALPLRNADIEDRQSLVIDPGPRSIAGPGEHGERYSFDGGTFLGVDVGLGELRTDEAGRLLVLGGQGRAGSARPDNPIVSFANNDGWFDDTADGPVTAKVTLKDGRELPVRASAWVVVGPPDFAPGIENLVTMYDVVEDVAVSQGWLPPPEVVSFTRDVYPILARAAGIVSVNAPAGRGHRAGPRPPADQSTGGEKVGDFLAPGRLARLSSNAEASRAARQQVFERLRDPSPPSPEKAKEQANFYYMPQLSGDGGDLTRDEPDTWFSFLPSQYAKLRRWAEGDFEADWQGAPPAPVALPEMPLPDQPGALDRAALEHCVGGPFFPGIEMTYVSRDPSFYSGPFRVRPDLEAGDLGKRMAVPWQADFYKCAGHWWPAQRPDDVVTEAEYEAVLASYRSAADGDGLGEEAVVPADAAFRRDRWDRGVGDRIRYEGEARRVVLERGTAGHNEMVEEWSDLGFVVPRAAPDGRATHWVEVGRGPYAALRDRDYFHIMMNLDKYPDFTPVAKQMAEGFLAQARALQEDVAVEDDLHPFPYSDRAYDARLEKIYNSLVDSAASYDPALDRVYARREDAVELLWQTAPFNQTDGAWLRRSADVGPIDEVRSLLFSVWMDEAGNGDPQHNHPNVFTDLLHSIGKYPNDINSRAYSDDPSFVDSAFTMPLLQLVISEFTENYLPEILGMTLYLEWEVVGLKGLIKLLDYHGISSQFYRLHVAIDNAADGHGAWAKRAVQLYLDQVRAESGEQTVQEQWRRIWDGYVAFKTTGTFGMDVFLKITNREPTPPANQIVELIAEKKRYGEVNHGLKRLGPNLINDLFEVPLEFMASLVSSGMIVPGKPDESPFFDLLDFTGPMYKVFNETEIELWREWTRSLGQEAPQPPADPTVMELMVRLVDTMRDRQQGEAGHTANQLTGPDPANPDQLVTQPVVWWFQQSPPAFLRALANEDNGWVVRGNASASKFVTELLRGDNRMGRALSQVAPGTTHRTWRSVAIDWINAGCPIPSEGLMLSMAPSRRRPEEALALAAAGPIPHLSILSRPEEVAAHPQGRILGMGSVH